MTEQSKNLYRGNRGKIDRLEEEIRIGKIPRRRRGGMKFKRIFGDTAGQIALGVLAVLWVIPLVYLVLQSFKKGAGAFQTSFFPAEYTLDNYRRLFSETNFPRWYLNTLAISLWSCLFTTLFVLMVAYALSRIRFKARRPLMNIMLVLGMFPGFMSMTAVFNLLKFLLPTTYRSSLSLILVYSAGAAMGYYIAKGFFDTVPKSLDEAARIDGASRARIFRKIILPISKPIIVYTVLISFIAPWCDFIFASLIMGTTGDSSAWTVALGLRDWTTRENLDSYFTLFCAGAVIVAVPITALFIWLQKYYVQGVTGGAVKG